MASATNSPELLVDTDRVDDPRPEVRSNRRDVLRALGAAAAGAVAGGLLSPKEAQAHGTFHADSSGGSPAIHGNNTSVGHGVEGTSSGGVGVEGSSSTGNGVQGIGPITGVAGLSQSGDGVAGSSNSGTGVIGSSITGDGVFGASDAGRAVVGSSNTGTAVEAFSTSGLALDVRGRVRFSTAGSGTIPAGQDSVLVGDAAVTGGSHITAMLTGHPGTALSGVPAVIQWVERLPGGFVLHLTRRVGPATPFTYLIVEPS